MNKYSFRPALPEDIPEIAETYVHAFNDNPVIQWLIRSDEQRSRAIREYFGYGLSRFFPAGGVYTSDDHMVCSSWFPSDYKPKKLTEEEENKLATMRVFWYTEKGLWKYETMNRLDEERAPAYPHWRLGMLGVRPEAQGKGIGSKHVLGKLRMLDEAGTPVYLTSSNPRNVPFYERLGFSVVDRIQLPEGPVITCMLKNPRLERL